MRQRFLRACARQPVDRPPVWFMRQAGRYMAEYRALRRSHSILEICKTPRLAAEVTQQPVEALDVDAAIVFADLLLPLEVMGLGLEFVKGEGPRIDPPVRSAAAVRRLQTDRSAELGYVGESIALARGHLGGRLPVIGFVGAPFTLASYMIEGGGSRHYAAAKSLMWGEPEVWRELMERIVDVLAPFAALQVAGGAAAIQVFDSWVGALSPLDYERFALPYSRDLIARIRAQSVPVIHFGTGNGAYLELFRRAGGDVLGLDWRVELGSAWDRVGHGVAVQGNLDPIALLAPLPELRARVHAVLDGAAGHPGHIFNLGHGIIPQTPVEHVRAAVQMVRDYRAVPVR
ncbi:MAG: uroporphyrinogen decarboxylase [Bryobacterales bacterium]|nr:uroporphyrinogen decarboxylase [Bryobacterales bacterium]